MEGYLLYPKNLLSWLIANVIIISASLVISILLLSTFKNHNLIVHVVYVLSFLTCLAYSKSYYSILEISENNFRFLIPVFLLATMPIVMINFN